MKTPLRNLKEFLSTSGVKDIKNAALSNEVAHALSLWVKNSAVNGKTPGVLIGGIALSFYSRPRYTTDADFLFLTDEEKPFFVEGFKRQGVRAFLEKQTHVEIETPTPKSINIPVEVARRVVSTANEFNGIKVASVEGLVALKLFAANTPSREFKDLADIVELLKHNVVDMNAWNLSSAHSERFVMCKERAKS